MKIHYVTKWCARVIGTFIDYIIYVVGRISFVVPVQSRTASKIHLEGE